MFGFGKNAIAEEAGRLADVVGLQTGWRVAEIGAGTGEFSECLSALVGPAGKVFVTEFSESKLENLKSKFAGAELRNVEVLQAGETSASLPVASLDLIVMRKVYHHFIDPQAMNASFHQSLKPGGWLAVVDFAPKWFLRHTTPKGIPANRGGHGIRKELIIDEVQSAGFRLRESIDDWASFGLYCVVFQKPVLIAEGG